MPAAKVENIVKTFGATRAVDDVSFEIQQGELFGLLGPNGAGKTTTLRIMLDIFKPDSGKTFILGGPMTEQKKDKIGYMPEERGLYQDIELERCLYYLSSLKGLDKHNATPRIENYLERFDLAAHRKKKIKELSKGMQQKAQLIVTLVHQPEIIIIDEPFSGLDPVNTKMVKDLLIEERREGKTIIMCTHQMNQVEEMADRLVLINRGKVVLYGETEAIRRDHSGKEIVIRTVNGVPLPVQLPGVIEQGVLNGGYRLVLDTHTSPQEVLRYCVTKDIPLEQFEIALPTLDEIFIKVVKGGEEPE